MGTVSSSFKIVTAETARAAIARSFLQSNQPWKKIGAVELQPHQLAAVSRIEASISEFGGAILCDPVGTGKTFTALACARRGTVLIIAPAVLREMWLRSAARCSVKAGFISFEALSRGANHAFAPCDLIIVDEAHHARNPATKRYRALSALIARHAVLMLTATPIHNRQSDLHALLELFLGEKARGLSSSELSRCMIRRDSLSASLALPSTLPVIWHELHCDDSIPLLLLSLPPPLPPSDGGVAASLVVNSLIRQWSSSNAALKAALRRRLVQSSALIAALDDGTLPSRRELQSWIGGDNAVQLSFSGFLASATSDSAALLNVVEAHRDGILQVLAEAGRRDFEDDSRAAIIETIMHEKAGKRIVAFASYAETVNAMFNRVMIKGRVAALTSKGARVAGGRISRIEAIERFAPRASAAVCPRDAEEITLLLTTDLLSEGVNLHDAACVIHLDLPWTPARVAQRVGRVVRIGSHHASVTTHAFHPPASAEVRIRIEGILREKEAEDELSRNAPRDDESVRDLVSSWVDHHDVGGPVAAAVRSVNPGFVAAVSKGDSVRLIAAVDNQVSDSPDIVLRRLRDCMADDVAVSPAEVAGWERRAVEWLSGDSALDEIRPHRSGTVRQLVLRRIDHLLTACRVHERSRLALIASDARRRLQQRLSHDDERRLAQHLTVAFDPWEWLEKIISILSSEPASHQMETRITAMVVLVPK